MKEVVGIVGDVKQGELAEAAAPTIYEHSREHVSGSLTLVLRTTVPPLSLGQAAATIVRDMDPELPVEDIRTMQAAVDSTLTSQRFSALLMGVFAAVALVLASVGIYSVLAYIVRGRSREIGIRTALGAKTSDVLRLVIMEGMTPALLGIVLGAVAVLGSAKILERLVFGVSASDPLTLGAVAGMLALVALLASLVPAYRASRVDPLTALRA
jgi:ABC-type antimicrobial peptide transport system permease subunit